MRALSIKVELGANYVTMTLTLFYEDENLWAVWDIRHFRFNSTESSKDCKEIMGTKFIVFNI